jgi:flagellar biogenesis protein FliO
MNLFNFLVLAVDAVTAPESPLTTPEMVPSYQGAFLKMFLTLLALIVGIFVMVWVIKRLATGRSSSGSGKSIQVLEKKALSPKTMLYLVDVDGKQTLIAESQLEVKKLMTFDAMEEKESD